MISDGRMKMIGTMDELRVATGKQRLREIFLDLLGLPRTTERKPPCDFL